NGTMHENNHQAVEYGYTIVESKKRNADAISPIASQVEKKGRGEPSRSGIETQYVVYLTGSNMNITAVNPDTVLKDLTDQFSPVCAGPPALLSDQCQQYGHRGSQCRKQKPV